MSNLKDYQCRGIVVIIVSVKMKKIVSLVVLFLLSSGLSFGQKGDGISDAQLFSEGIYLENLKILVPWKFNFGEISKYGNPVIVDDPNHRDQNLIKWDSVKILDGIVINLSYNKPKKYFKKNLASKITMMIGSTDSEGIEKLSSFFRKYTGRPGGFIKDKKVTLTQWTINGHKVYVGYGKIWGYFLWISNNGINS